MGTYNERSSGEDWKTILKISSNYIGKKVHIPQAKIFEDLGKYYIQTGYSRAEIINYKEFCSELKKIVEGSENNYEIFGELKFLPQTTENGAIGTEGVFGINVYKIAVRQGEI